MLQKKERNKEIAAKYMIKERKKNEWIYEEKKKMKTCKHFLFFLS